MKYTTSRQQPVLRSRLALLSQLLNAACSQLHLPAHCTKLLVDGVPLNGTEDVTLHNAGIDENSVLTVVAKQPVSLRCHRVVFEHSQRYDMKDVDFEAGKPLEESGPTLEEIEFVFCGSSIATYFLWESREVPQ